MLRSAGSLWRSGDFLLSFEVLHGSLRKKKIWRKNCLTFFFNFGHQKAGSRSGSGFTKSLDPQTASELKSYFRIKYGTRYATCQLLPYPAGSGIKVKTKVCLLIIKFIYLFTGTQLFILLRVGTRRRRTRTTRTWSGSSGRTSPSSRRCTGQTSAAPSPTPAWMFGTSAVSAPFWTSLTRLTLNIR